MPLNAQAVVTHLRARSWSRSDDLASAPAGEPRTESGAVENLDPDVLLVVGLYESVLERRPDPRGLRDNLGALRAGLTPEQVRDAVSGSDEARRHARSGEVPGVDELRVVGLEVVVRGTQVPEGRAARVARLARGVPLEVIASDLDGSRPAPWQQVLAAELLRWVPGTGPADLERAIVRVERREAPRAVLAPHLPGRGPLARWRRHRAARRAVDYAVLELASRTPATRVEVHERVRTVAAEPLVPTPPPARRSTSSSVDVRVVPVGDLLFGVPSREWRLGAYLEHRGHPEPGLADLMRQRVGPGTAFVDVGANIGLYTVEMAHRVGPTGTVVAFEPSPVTAEVLRQNVQLNGLAEGGTVRVVEAAAGDRPGSLPLALHDDDSGHNTLFPDARHDALVEVDVVTLDDTIPAGARVDVVKIDVEGAEAAVLRGMQRVVRENPQVVVFAELADEHLRRAGTSSAGFLEEAARLGWRYDVVDTGSGQPATPDGAGPLTACLVRETGAAS